MNVPRCARYVVASLLGIGAGLVAPTGRAQRTGIGVRYNAPAGCPTEGEFVDFVRQRNPRATAASALDPPQFLVTVTEGASPRFSGRLERVTSSGAIGVREISGESCREVTSALALITALTADLAPPPNEPQESSVGGTGRAADVASSSVALPDKPAAKEAPADPPADRPPPSNPSPSVSNTRWQGGLQGLFASGVTPNLLAGGTLFGQVGGRSSAFWVPSLRLSASVAASAWSSDTTEAHARFLWAVASLDACPVQLGDPLELSFQPCARLTGGWLRAAGTARLTNYEKSVPWTSVGALARAQWLVGRALLLDAEAELFVPGVHYDFDFKNPSETAEVAGPVGFRLGAGVGFVFR
jgi:hypothetical protein